MDLSKKDLFFILSHRKVPEIPLGYNVQKLLEKVGTLTKDETKLIEKWRKLSRRIEIPEAYINKSYMTIKRIFATKYGDIFRCPSTCSSVEDLLAFYQLEGYEIEPEEISYTPSQQAVLDKENGIICVNSGPGSGKTFTANSRAAKYAEEGVLLVSFSNEAIFQNYDRLGDHVNDIKKVGKKATSKQRGNQIDVTTVDSLAKDILGEKRGKEGTKDFEGVIASSISKLLSHHSPLFYDSYNRLRYHHLIIDEAQDLNDSRGNMLLLIFHLFKFKSIAIFGDPRQRINFGAGGWYQNLCISKTTKIMEKEYPVKNYAFEYSFRFKTRKMFQICNVMSECRPDIHVEMVPVDEDDLSLGNRITVLTEIEQIIDIVKAQEKLSNVVIISPSIDKVNNTSKTMKQIQDTMLAREISISHRTFTNVVQESVLFSTIHSVKGKEFDIVICVGFSNYPYTYSDIYGSLNDGISLNFVAHTRAKNRIYYYMPGSEYKLPANVIEDLVKISDFDKRQATIKLIREPEILSVNPSKIDPICANTFALVNGMNVKSKLAFSFQPSRDDSAKLSINYILAKLSGKDPFQLTKYKKNDYDVYTRTEYRDRQRSGLILEGIDITTGRFAVVEKAVFSDNIPSGIELVECLDEDDFRRDLESYVSMCSGISARANPHSGLITNMIRYTQGNDNEEIEVLNFRNIFLICEVRMFNSSIITCGDVVFTFAESNAVAYSIACFHSSKKKIVNINFSEGKAYLLTSKISPDQWKYWVESLIRIYIHSTLVKHRLNHRGIVPENDEAFFVDTEFNPRTRDIIEIAMVYSKDPYRSIVKLTNCDPSFGVSYFNGLRSLADFESGVNMETLESLFVANQDDEELPILYYFHCKTDVEWVGEEYEFIDSSKELLRSIDEKHLLKDRHKINQGDCYEIISGRTLASHHHIRQHTALSDSLILWELYQFKKKE